LSKHTNRTLSRQKLSIKKKKKIL